MNKTIVTLITLLHFSTAFSEDSFKSCTHCPAMKSIPGGQFILGSNKEATNKNKDEEPRVQINISDFATSIFEITRAEYKAFVVETGYQSINNCFTQQKNGAWGQKANSSWKNPGFEQKDNHPVVCVSWQDAKAYTAWLNTIQKKYRYRLLSESEWEYLAKVKNIKGSHINTEITTPYWWGTNENDFCKFTNGADISARKIYPNWLKTGNCNDSFVYTAPVGHFKVPNSFGLYDLVGNVWEWVEDCYRPNYKQQPIDGKPYLKSNCIERVVRGGAWGDYGSFYLRTNYRGDWKAAESFSNFGFRVAADINRDVGK